MRGISSWLALSVVAAAIAACSQVQSQGSPGNTLTVSWIAPTTNTDGSPILGSLTYDVLEVTSAPSASSGGTIVAGPVSTTSVQVTNVTAGEHCYTVVALEVVAGGPVAQSAYAEPPACVTVSAFVAPPANPNPPTNVKATTP